MGGQWGQWHIGGEIFHWSNSTGFCYSDGLVTTGHLCTKWMLFPNKHFDLGKERVGSPF